MSDEESTFNFKPLDQLIKALASKGYQTKIGILGSKDARTSENGKTPSNATIGNYHEQLQQAAGTEAGSTKLKRRSFLRMPLTQYLPEKLKKAGLLNKKDLEIIVKEGNTKQLAEKVGVVGVATVLEAFDTAGFGTWEDLAPSTWARKKVKQILVETHQLRDSIDFRVEENQ